MSSFSKLMTQSAFALAALSPLGLNQAFADTNINIVNNGVSTTITINSNMYISNDSSDNDVSPEDLAYNKKQLAFLKQIRNLNEPVAYIDLPIRVKNQMLREIDFYLEQTNEPKYDTTDRMSNGRAYDLSLDTLIARLTYIQQDLKNGYTLYDDNLHPQFVAAINKATDKYFREDVIQFYKENHVQHVTEQELSLSKLLSVVRTPQNLDTEIGKKSQLNFLKNLRQSYDPYNYVGFSDNVIKRINDDIAYYAKEVKEDIYTQADLDYRNKILNDKFISENDRLNVLERNQLLFKNHELFIVEHEKYELMAMTNLRAYRLKNHVPSVELTDELIFSHPNNDYYNSLYASHEVKPVEKQSLSTPQEDNSNLLRNLTIASSVLASIALVRSLAKNKTPKKETKTSSHSHTDFNLGSYSHFLKELDEGIDIAGKKIKIKK